MVTKNARPVQWGIFLVYSLLPFKYFHMGTSRTPPKGLCKPYGSNNQLNKLFNQSSFSQVAIDNEHVKPGAICFQLD